MGIDIYRNNQFDLVRLARLVRQSSTVGHTHSTSNISIICDQTHLGMLLTNQITEFMNVQ